MASDSNGVHPAYTGDYICSVLVSLREPKMARCLVRSVFFTLASLTVLALGSLASVLVGTRGLAPQIVTAKTIAYSIIAAAEKHCSEKGDHPSSINDLIPAYLAANPRAPIGFWGRDYRLEQTPQGGFALHFSAGISQRWIYDSGTRNWRDNTRS